jgi:NADPH:quinone reductase-like Zn-dependent oxidoreductase
MKQVTLRGGEAIVEEVPAPYLTSGQVLVKVAWSCVSPGTESARHQVIVAPVWG